MVRLRRSFGWPAGLTRKGGDHGATEDEVSGQ